MLGLSGCNDFKVKNYTNFYLTDNKKLTEILDISTKRLKSIKLKTRLSVGNTDLYIQFKNNTYGVPRFGSYTQPQNYTSNNYYKANFENLSAIAYDFIVEFFSNNRCNIYNKINNKKLYLCLDVNADVYFVEDRFLSFSLSSINPQDFLYAFSEDEDELYLFKDTSDKLYFITNQNNKGVALEVKGNNILTYLNGPFVINKNIYFDPNQTLDTSFITYNNDNTINIKKSLFNLKNNFLLHKRYSDDTSSSDIIILKNQVLQNERYSSANNLLSSQDTHLFVEGLREYTSILNPIKEEKNNSLELNYVFYNKPHLINPGSNIFQTSSSLYPFERLNINDTKFVASGAFSNITPQYADKIYKESDIPQIKTGEQYLLCTWLSGSPFGEEKIWVDRYYYPDLVEKETVAKYDSSLDSTYDEYIESLIQNNTILYEETKERKIFDKLSDMVFEPNTTYRYERINKIPPLSSTITYCDDFIVDYPVNYYNDLNDSNEATLLFYFSGDTSTWTIKSQQSQIKAGMTVSKTNTSVTFTYTAYNSSKKEYLSFSETAPFKPLKENFVAFSLNAMTGKGYFLLNNEIILSIDLPPYQFVSKKIFYGDFIVVKITNEYPLLAYKETDIYNYTISNEYLKPEFAYVMPLMANENTKIDPITITIPCGMSNSTDVIEYLNSVCDSTTFKSNAFNIIIKNLNITNKTVLNEVKTLISNNLSDYLPANAEINDITFKNHK